MFNTTKRVFALVLAIVLVFSLAGCSKPVDDGSSVEWVVEEQIEYVDGGSGNSNNNNDTTSGGNTTTSGDGTTSKDDKPNNPETLINDNVDYTKYKGRTVKFAATIDPKNDESGPMVKKFEEKYGIKIEVIQSDQGNYANQLAGWIAAGKSPDVARVNGDFPTCMGYLQSLDAAKLDYNEAFWNKNMFDYSTFGGSPYLCDAKNNIWTEIDIVIYSESMLKRAGASTPEEYDKAGKWTWDAYFEICRKLKKLDPSTMQGGSFASRENAIHAMGGSLIHYENGKFVSGVNKRTEEALVKYTTAWKEEIIGWTSIIDGIVKGTSGIGTSHAWALKKTGFFQNTTYNTADLGFYYLPRWDANSDYGNTGMVRGWGIIRGANEPVAAGIFLREYLDVSNYDSASTFISPEAETFFYRVTSIDYDKWNPYIVYHQYQDGIAGTTFDEHNNAMSGDPQQVGPAMASIKSCMERAAANINKFVEQNTGLK